MNKIVSLIVIILAFSSGKCIYGISSGEPNIAVPGSVDQDTIQKRQILYNGILWENKYHRIKEYQFLFSDFFLTGTIFIDGKTFDNTRIKYDLYLDELLTPLNRDEILKLNREKVDSFNISFEDKIYKFINIQDETVKGFKGNINVLYEGKSGLYVKYKKEISPSSSSQYDGEFYQTRQTFLIKGKVVYQINSPKDLFKVLNADDDQVKDFIKKSNLKISKRIPESYVQVIKYYDSISH
jgi:hypothetical protein